MRFALSIAALALTGCTSIPVSSVAVCVGVCKFTIAPGKPQTAAEQIGGGLANLFAQKLQRK